MEIKDWPLCLAESKLYRELAQLDLLEHIAELDVFGYTVVPPEKVGPPEFHVKVKEALVNLIEQRFGALAKNGKSWKDQNQIIRMILWEDEIFEELLLNPAGLGLVQYLVGTDCILSLMDGWVKGPGEGRTQLHQDNWDYSRAAKPPEPNSANFNYLATDYSRDDGAISFVPGSHKLRRAPTPAEIEHWTEHAEPVEAPAGSMVIWGDLTWHAAALRKKAGERLMVLGTYQRSILQTQGPYRQVVTQEALARNPKRFAGLMDVYGAFPFGKQEMDFERLGRRAEINKYHSLFDREPAGDTVSTRPAYDYAAFDADKFRATKKALLARAKQAKTKSAAGSAPKGKSSAKAKKNDKADTSKKLKLVKSKAQ